MITDAKPFLACRSLQGLGWEDGYYENMQHIF